tara:strand:+ start:864 stop:1034 length:171 start_codon:yes stop_codon:yes gene_type:complete
MKKKLIKKVITKVITKDESMIDLYNSLKDQDQGEGVYLGDDMYLQPDGEIIEDYEK